jgi:PAS domain S-box-containing protein
MESLENNTTHEQLEQLPFGLAFYKVEGREQLRLSCEFANAFFRKHIPQLAPTGSDEVWHQMHENWAGWLQNWHEDEQKEVLVKSKLNAEWCRLIGQRKADDQLAFQLYALGGCVPSVKHDQNGTNALLQQLTRLKSFLDSSTDSIQVSDIDGRMVYINQEGANRLGIDPEDIQLFLVSDFEPMFRDSGLWQAHINELRKNSLKIQSLNFHHQLNKKIPVEVNVSLRALSGEEFVIAISRDITDRSIAANNIQKHTAMLEILIHIANNYINVDLDKAPSIIQNSLRELAEFVEADRAYIFDYDFEKNITNNTYEWCAEGVSPEIDNLQGIPLEYIPQWVEKHKNGDAFFVDDVASLTGDLEGLKDILEPQDIISLITVPMISPQGLLGFVGFDSVKKRHMYTHKEKQLLDVFASMLVNIRLRVSAVVSMQTAIQDAEAASKAKSEFLANMSHELRTPLNGVIGFTDLLKSTPLNENQLEFVENASNSALSLMDLINDVLDLSKIEAGKLELEFSEVELFKILEQSIDIVKYEAWRKGLELVLDIHDGVPTHILADGIRLKQILINLLGNAVKFTESGEVCLNVKSIFRKNKLFIHFEVTDTGIGINQEQQTRLFQAFAQADSSTTRKFGGTGLGLTIANYLTRKMGGNIQLESSPGKGSRFYFNLSFSVVDKDKSSSNTDNMLENKEIWIIDDHTESRKAIRRSISGYKINVKDFATVEAVMPMGKPINPPDLIIMDYHMIGLNGHESLSLLKSRGGEAWLDVRVIMLHRITEHLSISQTDVSLGIHFKLAKPSRRDDLKYAIINALSDSKTKRKTPELAPLKPLIALLEEGASLIEILIVDDVQLNLSLARRMIQQMIPGVLIREASNGLEAVAWIEKGLRPQLVFMDVQMPELDGIEATRQIRLFEQEDNIHIPIIALTAGAVKEEKEKCIEAGMDDFLTKPIHTNELQAIIKQYLLRPRQPQSAD